MKKSIKFVNQYKINDYFYGENYYYS